MPFKIENNILYIYGKKNANVIYAGNELLYKFSLNDIDLENFLFWAKHQMSRGHKGSILFILDNTPVVLAPDMWKLFINIAEDYFIEQEIHKLKTA